VLELDLKDSNLGVSESSDVTDQPSGMVDPLSRGFILSLNTCMGFSFGLTSDGKLTV
jgi:hypothetical protein